MRVLHLVGLDGDRGGVLSVLRNLQEVTGDRVEHVAWMNARFHQTRTPALDCRRSIWARGEGVSKAGYLLGALPAFVAIKRLLARERFDVVHAHTRGALLPAVLLARQGRPVVFTNHNYARSARSLYRWAAHQRGMNTVLLSPSMAEHYGIDPVADRVRLIPAFCSDRYFDAPLRDREPWSGRTIRLTGLGMLVRWKGWHTVCEALAVLDPEDRERFSFDHYGTETDTSYVGELRDHATRFGLSASVQFHGATDDVDAVLSATDLLVHPAVDDPFPVAVLEALASGLPAIVTASGGPREVVEHGRTGLVFAPGDARVLAGHLRSIARGEWTAAEPRAIRDSVRHLGATTVANQYLDLYNELAGADAAIGHGR
ncbi:MAG: glycosyltransferase family 4 protein [Acidimicrobiia bacterium]